MATSTEPVVRPTKEEMREKYMASPQITWAGFCRSNGLNVNAGNRYPHDEWTTEKRRIIGQSGADELALLVFEHNGRWHRDVLKTLRDYPKVCDTALYVINAKFNLWAKSIKDKSSNAKSIDPKHILNLSNAYAKVVEARHRSLMIGEWTPQQAQKEQESHEEGGVIDVGKKRRRVEIKGVKELDDKELGEMLRGYYDPPQTNTGEQDAGSPPDPEKS